MSKIKALITPVTLFQQNAPIVYCVESLKCAFVDPGGDIEILMNSAKEHSLIPEKILLTHGHIDHAGGANELSEILKIPIEGPNKRDKFLLDGLEELGNKIGIPSRNCSPSIWLDEGDKVKIGNAKLDVFFCPGHTPGHIIFFHKDSDLALVGDVLFNGSIGRTDLPGGNFQELINTIEQKLWPLGDSVKFIPGHGPNSNFRHERLTNPFVADQRLR